MHDRNGHKCAGSAHKFTGLPRNQKMDKKSSSSRMCGKFVDDSVIMTHMPGYQKLKVNYSLRRTIAP